MFAFVSSSLCLHQPHLPTLFTIVSYVINFKTPKKKNKKVFVCMCVCTSSHHFAGVGLWVTQRDITVQMHLIIITNKLKDGDVEAAGEGHTILSHAYSVILDVRTPGITVMWRESCKLIGMYVGV